MPRFWSYPVKVESRVKILVVEDEAIVSRDIERQLRKAGYEVPALVASAEEALAQIAQTGPDLVLMDIRLQGPTDGIEAAREIRERFKLPVIFLTAHADDETLARAKLTQPFGYIIKPIGHSSLASSIEMALYRHRMDRQLEQQRALLNTILQTIPEAVIVADASSNVQFMNSAAERLTGWLPAEFCGRPLASVVALGNSQARNSPAELIERALQDGKTVRLPRGTRLHSRSRPAIEVDGHIAVSQAADLPAGLILTLYDSTLQHREEQQIRQEQSMLAVGRLAKDVANDYYSLLDMMFDCSQELVEGIGQDSPLRETASILQRATGTASLMTRQLLELGTIQTMRPEAVDVNHTFAKSLPFLERLCGPSVQLEMKLTPGVGSVFSYPSHLEQLALNLVLHAKDQLTGCGKISIRTSPLGQQKTESLASGRVRISIKTERPDGVDRPALLEPPRALDKPTLNLTIVNALVTAAEGSIRISEHSDRIYFTEVILPSVAALSDSRSPQASEKRYTVLSVAIELKLAIELHARLENSSFFVLHAANEQEAQLVSELYEGPIHLVITDSANLSRRAQHQLFNFVCRKHPNSAFLCLCSSPGAGPAREFDVLWKPFPPSELIEKALAMVAEEAFATGA